MSDTLIIIPGFAQSRLTSGGSGEGRTLWPLQIQPDTLIDRMKGPFMKLLFTRRDAGFTDTAVSLFRSFSEPLAIQPDGTSRYAVTPSAVPGMLGSNFPMEALSARYGERIHIFPNHFLLSPFDNARALASFLEHKGISRADVLTLNFGGGILLAYLDGFRDGRVGRAVCLSPCFEGLEIAADVYDGAVTPQTVNRYLTEMGGKTGESFRELLKLLPPDVTSALISKLIEAAKTDVLLGSGGAWAMVPGARYPALVQKLLREESYAPVKEKADAFDFLREKRDHVFGGGVTCIDGDVVRISDEAFRQALDALCG